MTVVVGLCCEDDGHFSTVTRLIDDTLVASVDWLDGILDHCRAWRRLSERHPFYKCDPSGDKDLRPLEVGGLRIPRHGHIAGEPLKPEAAMWRNVLQLFCQATPRPEVVVLVRDLDGYTERKAGAEQVRSGLSWPFEVVLAMAQPEIEAWLAAGFTPTHDREREALDKLRAELSFDPTTQSHRLTSHPNDARTDAKKVVVRLCGEDDADGQERRKACLADRDLLTSRGHDNGAAPFLREVDERVVPLFQKTPR